MAVLAAFAGLLAVLSSWIVGGRLLLLARSSRRAPELLIGLGLVMMGGLWSPLVAVGRQATALSDPLRAALVATGALCGVAGISSLAAFNWRVFRSADAWARALAISVGLALVASFAFQGLASSWDVYAREERGPWIASTWILVANYAWANLEAWRAHAMLVRRRKLGLADPVVVDRMRLWALALLASLIAAGTAALCQALGVPMGGTRVGLWLSCVAALSAGTFLLLAFLPPSSYLERVRRRAAANA